MQDVTAVSYTHLAMNLPDGKPLSIVCRMRGHQEAGRVPGPDLMPRIFELSEKKGYRHYFYGSTEKTLHALCLLYTSYLKEIGM